MDKNRHTCGSSFIGSKLISAGILLPRQRDELIAKQKQLRKEGTDIKFGELAVHIGYCSAEQIELLFASMDHRLRDRSW